MTSTLPGADIRAYYASLGIQIPGWARTEATVRCFADPDAHRRGDRDPSCRVNLEHGAWKCHACGAQGGAYDAAIALGRSQRSSIDLLVRFGLAERRGPHRNQRWFARAPRAQNAAQRLGVAVSAALDVGEADVQRWHTALLANSEMIAELARSRHWQLETFVELGLGLDHGRITIPIRNEDGRLQGVVRYRPQRAGRIPKMIAVPGTRLGLIPHPRHEQSPNILLTEGPPDMIAARSACLPAIAVPGDHAWRTDWAPLLAERDVTIVVDSDRPGRAAGQRIARDLKSVAARVKVVDLAHDRTDGYDLTDALLEGSAAGLRDRLSCEVRAPFGVGSCETR
jgi:hypothetical protein